jgi:hypothetical protein
MSKSVKILGKKALPIWLLVVVLVACGAGAAAGTVLAGKVTGEVPVAVSQALLTQVPVWKASLTNTTEAEVTQQVADHATMVAMPNRSFGAVADDNTAFQAAAEMAVGDWAYFYLPLKNASENELIGLLTLSVPECLEVEVFQAFHTGTHVSEVVRIGLNTWKFTLDKLADYVGDNGVADPIDGLGIVISVDDTCAPGYYTISGEIKQIAY